MYIKIRFPETERFRPNLVVVEFESSASVLVKFTSEKVLVLLLYVYRPETYFLKLHLNSFRQESDVICILNSLPHQQKTHLVTSKNTTAIG
jgi:hypothetical protein